jgi:DNA-binding HxlR family transcriptional regulator
MTSAYLVSRERMESLLETLEVLGSAQAMEVIRAYERGELDFSELAALED